MQTPPMNEVLALEDRCMIGDESGTAEALAKLRVADFGAVITSDDASAIQTDRLDEANERGRRWCAVGRAARPFRARSRSAEECKTLLARAPRDSADPRSRAHLAACRPQFERLVYGVGFRLLSAPAPAGRRGVSVMKYLPLLWANLRRKRLRTVLTFASVVV